MFTKIKDKNEIVKYQKIFENIFKNEKEKKTYENMLPADPGTGSEERDECDIYWFNQLEFWSAHKLHEKGTRYTNIFGLKESTNNLFSIDVEVNFSICGRDTGGIFAKDDKGNVIVARRLDNLNIGQGYKEPEYFIEKYKNDTIDIEGKKVALIGNLNSSEFLKNVESFIKEVVRIKNIKREELKNENINSTQKQIAKKTPIKHPTTTQHDILSNKYHLLDKFFSNTKEQLIELTFSDIEKILGFPLNKSLYSYKAAWLGTEEGSPTHNWKKTWCRNGYIVDSVDLQNKNVCFSKFLPELNRKEIYGNTNSPKKQQIFDTQKTNIIKKQKLNHTYKREYLNKAFDFIQPILPVFVGTNLKNNDKSWWQKLVLEKLNTKSTFDLPKQGTFDECINKLDVSLCLKIIIENWQEIFKKIIKDIRLSWVHELIEIRNDISHWTNEKNEKYTFEFINHTLNVMKLFMSSIDNDISKQIANLKVEFEERFLNE